MDNQTLKDNWQIYLQKNSRWHNKFHLEMPFGLVNDPNGLCFYDNAYQIFYQWNPTSCEHKNKHWGYTQTKDFINYTIPQIALAPVDDFDKHGCYSGSARSKNGKLEIFYTANLKDENNIRYPRQILAIKNKDNSFTKKEIIIETVPKGYTTHFRDPYLFSRDNRSFMILGAQRENLTGTALIYEEIAENNWQFKGELKTNYPDFGYMWECPNMLSIDGYDVLLFCPQGLKPQGNKYNNLYQSGYLIGKFNSDTLEFTHGEFQELDSGFDFYAPQVLVHEDRNILIGWIGMPERETEYPTTVEGWIHSLTMPRLLQLKDNKIYQTPISELNNLTKTAHYDLTKINVPSKIDLEINLKNLDRWQGTIKIQGENLILSYDKLTQEFCIDRTHLTLGGKGKRLFKVKAADILKLEIYVDTSIMEIYCQNGQACATLCYYPQDISKSISFDINCNKNAVKAKIYELNSFNFI